MEVYWKQGTQADNSTERDWIRHISFQQGQGMKNHRDLLCGQASFPCPDLLPSWLTLSLSISITLPDIVHGIFTKDRSLI
jgi:hypothetical protein